MYGASKADPPELTQARKTVLENIQKWLGTFTFLLCVIASTFRITHSAFRITTKLQHLTATKHIYSAPADPYCGCSVDASGAPSGWAYNDIWLDVVVIVDTSEAMSQAALDNVIHYFIHSSESDSIGVGVVRLFRRLGTNDTANVDIMT